MESQSRNEERWNALSHSLGVILGVLGFFVLLFFEKGKTPYSTLSIVIYSLSVIILFSASTIYHWVKEERLKALWRKIDHISIYFLIAGTYTPLALISLEKGNGWLIFWTVWGIALIGSTLKIFFTGKFEKISLFLYLFMGWLIVFDINNVLKNTTGTGLKLMLLGGAFYTLGTFFYAMKRLPYHHVIWHFFVLGGFLSHYFFILVDVI